MKRLLGLSLFGVLLVFGSVVMPLQARAEGEILTKCPRCGAPLTEAHAHEDEGLPFSVGTDHAFLSKYVWRGLNVTDDPVWQPDVWASYKGFTLNVWGNMDLTDINGNEAEFNEVDITVDYSWSMDSLSASAGFIRYEFPNTSYTGTSEAYLSLGYDILLQPSLSVYYDFDEADGFYSTLGINHSFEVPKFAEPVSMSLDLSVQVGFATKNWNNFYYGSDHTTCVDLLLGASLPVAIGENVTISPTVSYSTVMDRTLRTKTDNNDNIIWGVVLSASL